VNYGDFPKKATGVSDGLIRMNIFLTTDEPVSMRASSVAHEAYPDPSDDSLIGALMEAYASTDVRGYGSRLRRLRRDFLYCSLNRARDLRMRLSVRKRGDKLSELSTTACRMGAAQFFSVFLRCEADQRSARRPRLTVESRGHFRKSRDSKTRIGVTPLTALRQMFR
jgi:hypothetical protein